MAAGNLRDLEALLGHRFAQPELLAEALTHGSLRHEQQTSGRAADDSEATPPVKDNERLEFLGDAIVGLVVADLLYHRYPELDEGELTRLRAALVSRKHLGGVGVRIDLGSYLRLGKAEERSGGRRKVLLLANGVEALVAALYLEAGLPEAVRWIEQQVVEPYVGELRSELRERKTIGDYKSALQELLQARGSGQPEYVVEAESGPDHRKQFLVEARVTGGSADEGARAEGTTKKKAEQEAARKLYERLATKFQDRKAVTLEAAPETKAGEQEPAAPAQGQNGHPTERATQPSGTRRASRLTEGGS